MTRLRAFFVTIWAVCREMIDTLAFRTETKPRPAQGIALDARRAERRAEDERRATERLYPERNKHA